MTTTTRSGAAAILNTEANATAQGIARAAEDFRYDQDTAAFYETKRANGEPQAFHYGDRVQFDYEAGQADATTYTVIYCNSVGAKLLPDRAPWARHFGSPDRLVLAADQTPIPVSVLLARAEDFATDYAPGGHSHGWWTERAIEETKADHAKRLLDGIEIAAYGVAYTRRLHAAELVTVTVTTTTEHTIPRAELADIQGDTRTGRTGAGPRRALIRDHDNAARRGNAATTATAADGGEPLTLF